MAFAYGVCCDENLPSQFLLQLKNKRGINDHSLTFPSESSSYSTPVHSSLSSGYGLGGSSGGFSLGHAGALLNSGGSVGHGIGYPLASSGSLGLGYQSPGLSHGPLSHQSVSLGGHSAQSTYSVPSIANLGSGGSSNGLFAPSKTGPVTFGIHGGGGSGSTSGSSSYRAPVYASGGHRLSSYSNGESSNSLGFQIVLGGSSGTSSSYNLPTHSATSSPSHSVTGGLVIAGSHGGSPSSSYSLPTSASSHGISTLGGSSNAHSTPSSFTYPINSGSHEISTLSGDGSSGYASPSGSYGSSSTHPGFSGVSSGGSSYQLPISSGSHSGSANGVTYTTYVPSHSSGNSASYSSPSVSYATPNVNHAGSIGPSYSNADVSYSLSVNHVGSSSSPITAYTGNRGYTPTYYSSPSSHGALADSHGSYASVSPKYVGYVPGTKFYHADADSAKYDTISYSVPFGKY